MTRWQWFLLDLTVVTFQVAIVVLLVKEITHV